MSDAGTAAGILPAAQASRLLEGIDDAFEQVLHGRYGGGIEIVLLGTGQTARPQILRMPASGLEDRIQLLLYPSVDGNPPSSGHGVAVGEVTLSGPPANTIDDVSILSEMFDPQDANQAGDASAFCIGVLFAQADAGLVAVRSTEETAAAGRAATRQQRGFLAVQQRGGGRAHRRALPCGVAVSVTADLLARLGTAVARLGQDGPAVRKMALLVTLDVRLPL